MAELVALSGTGIVLFIRMEILQKITKSRLYYKLTVIS